MPPNRSPSAVSDSRPVNDLRVQPGTRYVYGPGLDFIPSRAHGACSTKHVGSSSATLTLAPFGVSGPIVLDNDMYVTCGSDHHPNVYQGLVFFRGWACIEIGAEMYYTCWVGLVRPTSLPPTVVRVCPDQAVLSLPGALPSCQGNPPVRKPDIKITLYEHFPIATPPKPTFVANKTTAISGKLYWANGNPVTPSYVLFLGGSAPGCTLTYFGVR